jgi:hypothetical protein
MAPLLAGEVIGPPGTPNVPNSGSGISTAGPDHANSICVFSGLNDMIVGEGPKSARTCSTLPSHAEGKQLTRL